MRLPFKLPLRSASGVLFLASLTVLVAACGSGQHTAPEQNAVTPMPTATLRTYPPVKEVTPTPATGFAVAPGPQPGMITATDYSLGLSAVIQPDPQSPSLCLAGAGCHRFEGVTLNVSNTAGRAVHIAPSYLVLRATEHTYLPLPPSKAASIHPGLIYLSATAVPAHATAANPYAVEALYALPRTGGHFQLVWRGHVIATLNVANETGNNVLLST